MTRDEFDAYVDRIERTYRGRGFALKCKVALMLALGYGLFFVWTGPLVILAIVFLATSSHVPAEASIIALVIGVLLLLVGIGQLLPLVWVKLEPQTGVVLSRRRFPEFFARIDELRRAARARPFRKIIVTIDFNAMVLWTPRLGILGWTTTDLVLGLPLLEVLTADEFESVMMHELAHHSAKHGRFSTWIYRVRVYWLQVIERFQQQSGQQKHVAWLLDKWLDWYWQRFHAYAFVLSRDNEYEADREAATWAGAQLTSLSLWITECHGMRIEEKFWRDIWSRANTDPSPPSDVMTRMNSLLDSAPDAADATRWINEATMRLTSTANTHPSLKDRVQALGCSVESLACDGFPARPTPSAAERWFADQVNDIRREVSEIWVKDVSDNWKSRHGRLAAQQRQITKLELAQTTNEEAASEILWAKAQALFDTHDVDATEQTLRQLLALDPNHSRANMALGHMLLGRGLIEGQDFLLQILKEEENDLIPDACTALSNFYQASGQGDRVAQVHHRLSLYQQAVAAGQRERNAVTASDTFIAHDLSPQELIELTAKLTEIPDLFAAYLVRKQLKHFTKQPLFVLCVHTTPGLFGLNASLNSQLASRVGTQIKLPGRRFVISPVLGFKALGKKVMKSPDSRIV